MQTRTRAGIFLTTLLALLTAPLTKPASLHAGGETLRHRAPEDDGRVATVIDRQGTALVRPVGRERWSPLRQRSLLMPGDQVRTSVRGANALEARFAKIGKLIVGPGTLVELGPQSVRLYRGELAIEIPEGKKASGVELTGPGGFRRVVKSDTVARVQGGKTVELAKPPRWLTGYKSSTTDEWVGSLVAKVDGRDVPLSVGYHKVDAVIRDQIAQTTVEQSFVNSTKNRLEGVFYFPLPADASISGFGMWIGGELVEADIVEKQRARQIYEDILRRKKDPGLLEWSGGNLFKARVFPIEPHSEKRIRIRYTQVLPMEGSTVRYRYALRSELLRKRPLRSLQMKISVSSAMKIADAASSTHEVRARKTEHAATLEFDAQEYTPEKDFEAAITLDRGAELTVVPHRRGEDGYFMMLLAPPSASSGKWQRDLMPEGKPVDLLVVADTSASMDVAARGNQADFILGLLRMLGKKDRFRLMTADVEISNFAADPANVSDKSIESAMAFLAARDSMGWTDIDQILGQVERLAKDGTVVVYVGDGIGTTGDADPVALAKRIRRLGEGCKGVVHAVSTASTYEQGVLSALASLGGGSVRSAGDDPAQAAFDLLAEAAQPAVKDLKVTFSGLRTARVYPETPPNLPVGQQQVLLGRFLPTGQDQAGRAVVTGTLSGKPVRYSAPVVLAAGEAGNSFIPRLWARRHLDALLSQGRTAQVKEDIVGFSQEFGIMTPYTSLLVLENDEDRKRYGVERRVKMRDGEKFFAKGRDDAATEILRQQMRQARTYRLQTRLRMLSELADLGRGLHGWAAAYGNQPVGGAEREALRSLGGFGGGGRSRGRGSWGPTSGAPGPMAPGAPMDGARFAKSEFAPREQGAGEEMQADKNAELSDMQEMDLPPAAKSIVANSDEFYMGASRRAKKRANYFEKDVRYERMSRYRSSQSLRMQQQLQSSSWNFASFGFPFLPAVGEDPKDPKRASWPKVVLDVLGSLDRRERVEKSELGFHFVADLDQVHPLQGRVTGWTTTAGYYAGGSWAFRETGMNRQPTMNWVLDGKRAVVAESFGLGRRRDAKPRDGRFAFPLLDYSTRDFARTYADYDAALEDLGGGKIKVVLSARKPRKFRMELTVDRDRRVVLRIATVNEGKTTSTTEFSEIVEKGGMHWAQLVTHRDDLGRPTWRRRLRVNTAPKAETLNSAKAWLGGLPNELFVGQKDPKIAAAKQAIHSGEAGVAALLRIVTHYAATQQWKETWAAWAKVEAKLGTRRAVPWMRLRLHAASRQGEEFKTELDAIAADWPGVDGRRATMPPGIDFLVVSARSMASQILSHTEQLTFLEKLKPVYLRPGAKKARPRDVADAHARQIAYRRAHADYVGSLGRLDEALRAKQKLAADFPDHFDTVMGYVNALGSASDRRRQSVVIAATLKREGKWLEAEISQLYSSWLGVLFYQRDLPGLQRVADESTKADPRNAMAWQCYLASRMFRDRGDEVRTWIGARLGEALAVKDEVQMAKLRAAARHAMGRGWNMHTNTVADRWHAPLASLVRRLARSGRSSALGLANEILGNYYFRNTDAFRSLRKEFLTDLLGEDGIAKMSLSRLSIYLTWVEWGRNGIDKPDWEKARDLLRARFDAAADVGSQQALGGYVLKLLDAWQEKKPALAFLRHWLKNAKGSPESVAHILFGRVLGMEWSKEYEDEAFALVPKLQPKNAEEAQREQIASGAIRRLADALVGTRTRALLGPVAELEKLPRQERRDREKTAKKSAREALAARFGAAAGDGDGHEVRWFRIESLAFAAEAGAARAASVAQAAELLNRVPGKGSDDEPILRRVLRERCSIVMAYAATRRGAAKSVGDAALGHYRAQLEKNEKTLDWRYQIYRLLVALDRTDALAKQLRAWIDPAKADTTWRRSLGYLLAERGKLKDAVELFEGVESADELFPADYDALANWHLVLGDDARRGRALDRKLRTSSESQLSQILNAAQAKVNQRGGGLPGALDSEDLRGIRILMSKASRPENYMWRIQNVYRASKDFRVLGCIPYGVVGHTSGSVYRFLGRVAQVVRGIHEEASCDNLSEAIAKLADEAARTLDKRGLLMITAQVERRAAEVQNQSGPHIEAALAAMKESFQGEWGRGERALMANYLASLGRIHHSSLANEQLRQLRELLKSADLASGARLQVAGAYARTLWGYGKRDEALDTLAMALDGHREVYGGVLPRGANNAVSTYASYCRQRHHFERGEKFLLSERERQGLQRQKNWYTQQLDGLYIDCISKRGEVGLGQGEKLYAALRADLLKRMWGGGKDVMDPAFSSFLNLHQAAAKAGIRKAGADLNAWAKKALPELAVRFVLDQGNRINRVGSTVRNVTNARDALEVLVSALEREPKWLRSVHREYWRNFTWSLAKFRVEARNRRLDDRLLPIALRELRIDLGRKNWRNTTMFWRNNRWFWSGAAGDFARVTQKFIEDNDASVAKVVFGATYLWNGLAQKDAAIDALASLHERGRLPEGGRWQLARWYEEAREYDAAIPILKQLVAEREDRLDYRVRLVAVHFKSGDADAARALMLATHQRWVAKKWWNEGSMVSLAKTAFDSRFWQEAATWYEEAVRSNERTGTRRWNWRGSRSGYYGFLARAHAHLGNTDLAIDAASAAVVTWGNDKRNQKAAIQALHRVIARVSDLDGYVKRWDAKVADTGLDAPLIRKHLGMVYLENGLAAKAIAQLLLARELQPADDEVHKKLLAGYDRLGDQKGAIAALKTSITMSR